MLAVILTQVLVLMRVSITKFTAALAAATIVGALFWTGWLGRDLVPTEALAVIGLEFLVFLAYPDLFYSDEEIGKEEKKEGKEE